MHVYADTRISEEEVRSKFESVSRGAATDSSRKLSYETGRNPPKFFLSGLPVTPPAAAEVAILTRSGGAEVVLRLMWGPLPAPFPRALALAGLLLGLGLALFANGSAGMLAAAFLVSMLPVAALLYQKAGERRLQSQLGDLLGVTRFLPKPH